MTNEELNKIGSTILDSAISVHRELGPGLLESAYEMALFYELTSRGLGVTRQVPVSLVFKGRPLGKGYEVDLVVEDEVIVEVKSVLDMHPVYTAQIITYLKLRQNRLGYLINFNVVLLKEGFKRVVFNF